MYGELFDIPAPDELLMVSWFKGGEVFRSGCTFTRGHGKIFYFRPGHETYPTYHKPSDPSGTGQRRPLGRPERWSGSDLPQLSSARSAWRLAASGALRRHRDRRRDDGHRRRLGARQARSEGRSCFEQFEHVHPHGAHSGETRVIRHAYAEGPDYVPFVFRADDLWMELEAVTGETVFHRVGVLELSAPGNDHAQLARASAARPRRYRSSGWRRTRSGVASPNSRSSDDWVGGFGDRGGFLDVDRSLRAMAAKPALRVSRSTSNAEVEDWSLDVAACDGPCRQASDTGRTGRSSRPAVGRAEVLGGVELPLKVLRKTLFWLEVDQPERLLPDGFRSTSLASRGIEFYGFPTWASRESRWRVHSGGDETDPRDERIAKRQRCRERAEIVACGPTGAEWHYWQGTACDDMHLYADAGSRFHR